MGTPPASNALDQMRNVQSRARFGIAEYASVCCDKLYRGPSARTGATHVRTIGVTTATNDWLAVSSFAAGTDGSDLFLSAAAQHALLGQLPGLHP